jgi:hypothetical protein
MKAPQELDETLDTSDVDRYVGQRVGGGQLREPVSATDIRRWVQAMNYPNPRHFEGEAGEQGTSGQIVAPQSFVAACDNHGMIPAIVGKIPGQHVIFGGGEWWFSGPRLHPGDTVRVERRFDGYTIAETKFAGPTMFSRGDSLYRNQRQDLIAKHRSTAVRYLPEIARKRGYYDQSSGEAPNFSADQLAEIQRQQTEWLRSGASGEGPGDVRVGDRLPTRPIGPHSATSFAAEYRAFIPSVWGAQEMEGTFFGADAGWLPEMAMDVSQRPDGVNRGPASGHTNLDKAKLVGFPRHYGYGSSMGVWVLDYLAYWAGDNGFVRHSRVDYRAPIFEGDVAFLDGEVTAVGFEPLLGVQTAAVKVSMTNQDQTVIARGDVQVELEPR